MIKNKIQTKPSKKKPLTTTSIKSSQYKISHHKLIGRKNEKGESKALKPLIFERQTRNKLCKKD
jgi:hypothetical protein